MFYNLDDIMNALQDSIPEYELGSIRAVIRKIQYEPITVDKAIEILNEMKFKKELGIDCTRLLIQVLRHDYNEKIDKIIKSQSINWKIDAIKLRREITAEGLVDAKNYVVQRAEELGYSWS